MSSGDEYAVVSLDLGLGSYAHDLPPPGNQNMMFYGSAGQDSWILLLTMFPELRHLSSSSTCLAILVQHHTMRLDIRDRSL
jgi:hypothetical protein